MTTKAAPAPLFTDISAADPRDIDEHLARLGDERAGLMHRLFSLRDTLCRVEKMNTLEYARYTGAGIPQLQLSIRDAEVRLVEITHLLYPLEIEFDRRPWSRYYLVDGGHLHYDVSGDRCNRDFRTTHYWMTEFSGTAPKLVIAKAGERVCTKCFPEAPVNSRPAHARFMTMTEAEKAAYAEAKARKAAAKKAAQITTPEGGELIVGESRDHIKTERAAWGRAMADATTLAYYGDKDAASERAAIEACLEALAHRRDVTVESLRAELNKKIAAKGRREGFEVLATA